MIDDVSVRLAQIEKELIALKNEKLADLPSCCSQPKSEYDIAVDNAMKAYEEAIAIPKKRFQNISDDYIVDINETIRDLIQLMEDFRSKQRVYENDMLKAKAEYEKAVHKARNSKYKRAE